MTNYMKTCSFLNANFSETMKVVEYMLRKACGEKKTHLLKRQLLLAHIGIDSMRQCVTSTNITEIKKTILRVTLT